MSKQIFCEKTKEIIKNKIDAVEHTNLDELLKEDENFEFILSLAYMTLSKEKIIKKDIKNKDRLGRLTKLVEQKEIDKVFDSNFSKELPNIISTLENDNLWILDNIRDSIMHGAFEIDEENKKVLIDNNDHDRNLKTEIPFKWFIDYAKNDILNKKISDEYTVYGFYRNKYKANKKDRKTEIELKNNIPYFFKVSGTTFNVDEIEKRIKELYKEYSQNDYEDSELEKYDKKIEKYKQIYHKKYLLSFYLSSLKVKETLEKEYPKIEVKVGIKDRNEVIKKVIKGCPEYYINYDFMMDEFDKKISRKGINLLNCLENIIEKIEEYRENDFSNLSLNEKFNIVNEIVSKEKKEHKMDIKQLYYSNENILKSLFLNIYGITTLVVNQETLYNQHFLNERPEEYGIQAMNKNTYFELADLKRKLEVRLIESDIVIPQLEEQYKRCTDDNKKELLNNKLNGLKLEKTKTREQFYQVANELDYRRVIKGTEADLNMMSTLENNIEILYSNFRNAMTNKEKFELKKQLKKALENYVKETSKFTYGRCRTMNEALTIIRNCFSHIGRTTIGKEKIDKFLRTHRYIYLTDYDNNNEISGMVSCEYDDLLNILNSPYENQKTLTK